MARLLVRHRGAHQPRHPAPPGAAAPQQPAPDRADERAALLDARHTRRVLRRRDRDGRQHLPRRPQRRAHADAVVGRPQRRLLRGQPAAPVPPGDRRSRVPLRSRQRGGAGRQPAVTAELDAPLDRAAQEPPRVCTRHARVPASRQPQGACLRAHAGRGADPGDRQPLALSAVRAAGSLDLRRHAAGGDVRSSRISPLRQGALPGHARSTCLLLVLSGTQESRRRGARRPARRCARAGARRRPGGPGAR